MSIIYNLHSYEKKKNKYFNKINQYFKIIKPTTKSRYKKSEIINFLKEDYGIEFDRNLSEFFFSAFLIHKDKDLSDLKKKPCQINSVVVKDYKTTSDEFLKSFAWRKLRYSALLKNNGHCELCGRGKEHGIILHVDHIKPRKLHPELSIDPDNLQVLCELCNHGKGNWDETDWKSNPTR